MPSQLDVAAGSHSSRSTARAEDEGPAASAPAPGTRRRRRRAHHHASANQPHGTAPRASSLRKTRRTLRQRQRQQANAGVRSLFTPAATTTTTTTRVAATPAAQGSGGLTWTDPLDAIGAGTGGGKAKQRGRGFVDNYQPSIYGAGYVLLYQSARNARFQQQYSGGWFVACGIASVVAGCTNLCLR